jgi:cytochrome c-type biogenesis protein CcmE
VPDDHRPDDHGHDHGHGHGHDHDRLDEDRHDDDIRPFAEAGRPPRHGRTFQRNRLRLGLVIAAIAGLVAFVLLQGLGSATTYFRNADEAVADRASLGTDRFRLQGTVVEGSRRQVGDTVEFSVSYECAVVPVVHRGDPPELFKEGIPVVLEGAFAERGNAYQSDRIFVRHTEEYSTERLEAAERDGCAGAAGEQAAGS